MKTSQHLFTLLVAFCLFFGIQSVKAQDNISWLDNYTSVITVGSNTCSYSFKTVDNNQCKISIEEKKTDKKGVVTTMTYQFYLSDLNSSALNLKTSGSTAIVSMEIKQSQKFIRVYKNGELEGYTTKIEISMSEIDKARSFIDVMKSNVENCKTTDRKWTSRDEAINWLTQNITKSETSGTVFSQTFKAGEKSYLANLESVTTDSKGAKQSMIYDFNLNDINPAKINMVVADKTFRIELPVRENNYYIRLKKGNEEIIYVKAIEIYSDDLEQARNILNSLVYLVNETPAPLRKACDSYQAALGFVKDNISDVKSGTSTLGQSFGFDASPSGLVQFTTSKTDSKGVVSKNIESFYLSDLQPVVNLEVSSKTITLNLLTKDKNKFIKESNEKSILAYSSSVEILGSDLEKARDLVNALEFAIGKSEKGIQEFGSVENAISWITANVGQVIIEAEKTDQSIRVVASNENKVELVTETTSGSGAAVSEFFEIYPEDIKLENTKIKVSGKRLAVILSTGKLDYIKCFKDKVQQNYNSDTEILFDDLLKAKNFIAAITVLHNKSLVADRSITVKANAWSYIIENVKRAEVTGENFDQKIDQRENDPCKAKLTQTETNSKGISVENIYEFVMSDIDPAISEIAVSSKNLKLILIDKNKQKLIKPSKNGVAGNFVDRVEIEVDNVLVAKKLFASISSLAGLCK